jgi:hypothetical protein
MLLTFAKRELRLDFALPGTTSRVTSKATRAEILGRLRMLVPLALAAPTARSAQR